MFYLFNFILGRLWLVTICVTLSLEILSGSFSVRICSFSKLLLSSVHKKKTIHEFTSSFDYYYIWFLQFSFALCEYGICIRGSAKFLCGDSGTHTLHAPWGSQRTASLLSSITLCFRQDLFAIYHSIFQCCRPVSSRAFPASVFRPTLVKPVGTAVHDFRMTENSNLKSPPQVLL